MTEELFRYQIAGSRWLSRHVHALLADDMGLGKSAQAIHGADLIQAQDILVVCPGCVRVNWSREFARFSTLQRPVKALTTGKDAIPAHGVVIISYDLLHAHRKALKARQWDLVLMDEAHLAKERSAKRTRALYGIGKRSPGIVASAKRCWRISGTPAPNNAAEMWTHLHSAGVTELDYWDFVGAFCTGFQGTYDFKITGHKNVEQLKDLLEPFMLRRKKEEVFKDMPPIVFHEVTVARSAVDLDSEFFRDLPQQEGLLAEIQAADAALAAALAGASSVEERLSLLEAQAQALVTLRRYIAMAKLPAVLDIIEEELESGQLEKVVLFGVHQCVVEAAMQRLSRFGAVTYYGKTAKGKRQANIDTFQNDPKCRVFIGNVGAAGTGITLTSACEVGFLEQDWVPSNNLQAACRCHRIGQTRPVRVRIFSLFGSVDERVQETLMRKSRELAKIL